MLHARNVVKSFEAKQILKGIDIDVRPGRISVLIGPSGAGKTTLIRALALLDLPDAGQIDFNGRVYEFPLRRGEKVAPPWPELTVVFQQHFLWPHLTLRGNIMLPLRELNRSRTRIDDLIAVFNMEEFIDRYPNEVSLGERQRAALARVFALEPSCILLDEITSAIDVEQTGAVVRHLLTLRDRGIGMLVVTHLLEFARQLVARDEGDQIYFLDHGKITATGGPEFFRQPGDPRVERFLSSMNYWASPRVDARRESGKGET